MFPLINLIDKIKKVKERNEQLIKTNQMKHYIKIEPLIKFISWINNPCSINVIASLRAPNIILIKDGVDATDSMSERIVYDLNTSELIFVTEHWKDQLMMFIQHGQVFYQFCQENKAYVLVSEHKEWFTNSKINPFSDSTTAIVKCDESVEDHRIKLKWEGEPKPLPKEPKEPKKKCLLPPFSLDGEDGKTIYPKETDADIDIENETQVDEFNIFNSNMPFKLLTEEEATQNTQNTQNGQNVQRYTVNYENDTIEPYELKEPPIVTREYRKRIREINDMDLVELDSDDSWHDLFKT